MDRILLVGEDFFQGADRRNRVDIRTLEPIFHGRDSGLTPPEECDPLLGSAGIVTRARIKGRQLLGECSLISRRCSSRYENAGSLVVPPGGPKDLGPLAVRRGLSRS